MPPAPPTPAEHPAKGGAARGLARLRSRGGHVLAHAITNEDFAPATPHAALIRTLETLLPRSRIVTDPLRRLAYGTDASFYRLVPEVVAIVDTEPEVQGLLRMCRMYGTPVTF